MGFNLFICSINHPNLLFLYRIFIGIYPIAAWILGFVNPKAKQWHTGRKEILMQIAAALTSNTKRVIWMHCASLGEFEQGRPVLEGLKKQYPNYTILLTFFSPSGYEVHKNYSGADFVFYLPMDSKKNAGQFLTIVKPSIAIFVKYEFWHYYLTGLQKQQIPTILIAGIFRKDQLFFKWYGGFYRHLLHCFSVFFVQDQRSLSLLDSIGIKNEVYTSGDTRFDRVIEIAAAFTPIDPIAHFCNNSLVLVAGSTWFQDDETIAHFEKVNPNIKFIIAPHDITHQRLQNCLTLYKNAVLYSDYVKGFNSSPQNFNTLIIDNIGMLSKLYHYANVTFIGGGFGADGIHNCLEAAVHYKPVLFGPVFDKYIEAAALVDTGGAISIKDALDFERVANKLFSNEADRKNMGQLAGDFIHAHKGATTKIVTYIQEKRLLTS
jgi:3-deoxy-D-manno-octulosonic-acid transferase